MPIALFEEALSAMRSTLSKWPLLADFVLRFF